MNKQELFDELGNIDAKYIEEAEKSKGSWKKWAAMAAAFVLLAGAAAASSDSVQAAIKKFFRFIPGVTIEEQKNPDRPYVGVLYSMDGDPMTQSDENVTVTVQNAYVTPYDVSVVYKIKYNFREDLDKFTSAEDIQKILDEKGIDYLYISDPDREYAPFLRCRASLLIAGEEYTDLGESGGGSTDEAVFTVNARPYTHTLKDYGQDLPITLQIGDMSFDIKLKPIEVYNSVEEIGPTAIHNDISLTAMPRWEGDTLYIKIYSINLSEFTQVYGFMDYGDIYGEGSKGPYLTIGGQTIPAEYDGGDGTEFYFELEGFSDEEKAAASFHVPVVEVRNDEEIVLNFDIAKDGTIKFDRKISFKYADINITKMTLGSERWDDSIGIEFTTTDKKDGIRLGEIHFDKINNRITGGTGSWTEREGNSWKAAFANDSIDIRDYTSVRLNSPTYMLDDEYVFTLN